MGGDSAGTQDPTTVEDLEACLDDVGAAEAATAVGEMKDPGTYISEPFFPNSDHCISIRYRGSIDLHFTH